MARGGSRSNKDQGGGGGSTTKDPAENAATSSAATSPAAVEDLDGGCGGESESRLKGWDVRHGEGVMAK